VGEAVDDAFKRLLKPSIETEFAALSKQKADEEAIVVFAENLRQLLLAAPLGQKRVMAVDPGFANGCKTCCLDAQGNLIHHEIVYPHPPRNRKSEATAAIQRMVKMYQVEAMAVGNGTASRETSDWLHSIDFVHPVDIYVVSEDGASIYSASKIARDEFPDEDVTVRGAVSIGRRLMDPLAELVKIDPKSIGVGQYQHDVDQTQLKKSLDTVVMSCVNSVGVNLNTASQHLLTYVSGLGPTLAKNIVEYRRENGAFASRAQLKKVPRLGPSAFEQCAGFLRIPGAKNPLDNSAVHPERYALVEQMAKDQGVTVKQLVEDKALQKAVEAAVIELGEAAVPWPMVEDRHGRKVVQTARVIPAAGHIDTTDWPACKSIGVIDSWRKVGDKPAQWERRYYISSRDLDGEALGRAVRAHWGIENRLHWVLDVGFGEDASTVRKDYAPQNLSLLKKMVLNLVRPVPMGKNGKMSLRMKRKATAWSDEERVRVLGLEPI
jgi:competence ComEA-like helix-hairpin-helix protein